MIRAVYRDGKIQPVDKVPPDWPEGQSLEIRPLAPFDVPTDTDDWINERGAYANYTGEMPQHVREELQRRIAAFEALGPVEYEPGEEEEINNFLRQMDDIGVRQMEQLGEQQP